jgi:WD domain, G-beta repeat
VTSVSFSPDSTLIVTGSSDRTAMVWDARTGTAVLGLKGHTSPVISVSFSPDGARIVTGGGEYAKPGEAKLWNARVGTTLLDLKGHTSWVTSASFSPDGTRIVTGSYDQTAKVWDAQTGAALLELKGHTGDVRSVSFSPDGTRIVTGSGDNTAKVWDARTGTAFVDLKGHTNPVISMAFSPDGARIVTGSLDRTAILWDARTGTAQLELKGHTDTVRSVSFSPDGTRIVTGSLDRTAILWDARTGTALLKLKGHTSDVFSVSFSADGSRIVTDGGEYFTHRESKVWDARTGRELKGEPIPPVRRPGPISPDGRIIAQVAGNRVELIPLQPDGKELSYRRLLMQPNYERYGEGYDAARAANDEFAARFYLRLLPPPERARHQAKAIVAPLFARLLLRDAVLAALKAQPAADPEVQAACLAIAGAWTESVSEYNNVGWSLVREPGQPDAIYQRGLRLAKAACRLEPDNGLYLNTLGVAQYRCGLVAEALATLTRSNDLNRENEPSDLAFLALAQSRLGRSENARSTLGRLRELMKNPERAKDQEAQDFLREAETIELDQAFPADPFAR